MHLIILSNRNTPSRLKPSVHNTPPRLKPSVHNTPPRLQPSVHNTPPRLKPSVHNTPPRWLGHGKNDALEVSSSISKALELYPP